MLNRPDPQTAQDQRSFRLYMLIVAALFALMLLRLLFLQVVDWNRLQLRSIDNIIQVVQTPAPRGDIRDRAGRPLAVNIRVNRLLYKPPWDIAHYFPTKDERALLHASLALPTYLYKGNEDDLQNGKPLEEIYELGQHLGIPYEQLMRGLDRELRRLNGSGYNGFKPATLLNDISFEQVVFLDEHRADFPGFFIDDYAFTRAYPLGEASSHLIGYTGLPSEHDPASIRALGFTNIEQVGKDGVEQRYEELLHGTQGRRNIEVDRSRIFQDIVSNIKPQKGMDVYLTVDSRVQKLAYDALNGQRGAMIICALMPGHEGEVIALVSSPGFDPLRIKNDEYFTKLRENELMLPLLDRAYRSAFHPGSTFKIVTATAALQTKTITPETTFGCGGKYTVKSKYKGGDKDFHCWNRAGHGYSNLTTALAKSCDIYFYQTARALPDPPTTLNDYARMFGYGEPIGLDLPHEDDGLVPNKRWKQRHYESIGYPSDGKWFTGNTLNYGIGQEFLTATPLQVLWSAAIVAWRGERYVPHLLFAHGGGTGVVKEPEQRSRRTKLDAEALTSVEQGMRAAVTDGTCKKLNDLGMGVCAKTGTAETTRGDDHAWVVGYYPQSSPRYAFVCLIEHGGHGAEAAIPPIHQVLKFMQVHDPINEVPKAKLQANR